MNKMSKIDGGVTAANGFKAAGVEAGIKYQNRKDMALVYSEVPCIAAGTFTRNIVKAAPVLWDKDIIENAEYVQAIVANSGIANACTGELGKKNNKAMAELVAKELNIKPEMVLTASTGVIGKQLIMEPIEYGVKKLVESLADTKEAGTIAAQSIMTTDTHKKEVAVQFRIGNHTITVGGMSKGSGMIHPNMGTMLAFLTTDIAITKELLQEAIYEDVQSTYNMISVDGDTSTNDSCFLLANGLAGNDMITSKTEDYYKFVEALHAVNKELAKQMAADGEGATKLIEVKVMNAVSKSEAVLLSKSVACSSLVKAAIYGSDANWGRIMCALGYSGVTFNPEKVDLYYESVEGKLKVAENGIDTDFNEEFATKILSAKEVSLFIDIKMGDASATAWGCDLTYDYVKINADYRS